MTLPAAPFLQDIREPLRFAREARHSVGVEHDGTFPGESGQNARTRFLADAHARSDRKCVEPAIGKKPRQLLGAIDGPDHDRQIARGIHRKRFAGARDGDETGAGPERAAGCEPGGSGRPGRAGGDDRMSAVVLMSAQLRPRKMREPKLRRVLEGLGPDVRQYAIGYSDIGNPDGSTKKPTRKKHMARLLAKECDGLRSLDGKPHDGAGGPVDAARQIHGDDRGGLRIHAFDHRPWQTFDRAIEAGAEQRVDDDVRARKGCGLRRHNWTGPSLGSQRSVPLEPTHLADQQNLGRVAPLSEQPSGHKTVAAVVARSGNDIDPAAGSKARTDCISNGLAGPLHQPDTGHTSGGYRSPISIRHFGIGEEFNHGVRLDSSGSDETLGGYD